MNEKTSLLPNESWTKPTNNGTNSNFIRNLGAPYLKNKKGIRERKIK